MLKVPVVFIIYKRLETTIRVWEIISKLKPFKLYVIADGPRCNEEKFKCLEVRNFVEDNIDWDCELIKVYSDTNLGCAKRVQTGLDHVFEIEEKAIILEDDTLPDPSFFNFCEELLERYKDDKRVAHISGCNLYSNEINLKESYCFSSIVNIWGWATWKRAWNNYDINMPSWDNEDKESFLSHWCPDRKSIEGIRKMFDLHCNNEDPWTWDYQWVYSCWKNKSYSVIPQKNLVTNIGIGPDASNTKLNTQVSMYPKVLQSMTLELTHPQIKRNKSFEKKYYEESKPNLIRILKQKFKKLLNFYEKDFK